MVNSNPTGPVPLVLVEDEADLQETLALSLDRRGFDVSTADTGEDGLRLVRETRPPLVLLDLMLPGINGLEVCRIIRADPQLRDTAVIMLTAKDEEADIIRGLELGADDYITKPFSPRVLAARIEAVLRRRDTGGEDDADVLVVGPLRLDVQRHQVRQGGEDIELTATEFKLLRLLMKRPGRVYTRQQIIESIHEGFAAVTDRSVDVQVVALRRKLGDAGAAIETVRGVGYRLRG